MTIYQHVQKYFSILTTCMLIPVYTWHQSVQCMAPPTFTTHFSLTPIGVWVNATPQVREKKSTHWSKEALNYSLLHGHLSHTWHGKGGGHKEEREREREIRKTRVIDCFIIS